MASFAQKLAATLTTHAWSSGGEELAVSPNNAEVHIYRASSASPQGWQRTSVLKKHDQRVSGLDWNPVPGRRQLFSCSHDRTAYVWAFDGAVGDWTPQIVVLRHDRAALAGKWSPSGDLIAVGSGSKTVCVCYFDTSNRWWTCKVIRRRHTSSVVALDWHPSGTLLATASTDGKFRVINANVNGTGQEATCQSSQFGEVLLEVDCGSTWVHDIAWSLDGSKLTACTHSCVVYVVDGLDPGDPQSFTSASSNVAMITLTTLPLKALLFISDHILLGAGFDAKVFSFTCAGAKGWRQSHAVDEQVSPDKAKGLGGHKRQSFIAKLGMFKSQVEKGQSGQAGKAAGHVIHKQPIISMRLLKESNRFSTCGLDGQVGVWNIAKLMASLPE
eukprot:jgi/Tetstr1/435084/TSEL_024053.t1